MAQAKRDFITRRAILSGVAALPVAAVPALPSPDVAGAPSGLLAPPAEPDPIFAAIAAHARAYDDLAAFAGELAAAEQAAWHAPRGARRAANKRLRQAYAAEGRFVDILGDAAERFVATVPQTLRGVAAALAYVRERYAQGYPMCEEEECMTLFASTEQAICRAAGLPVPRAA
ncbi:MAG: hypothetical protein QOH60_5594 [Mycobacterium sp.]|jgi:hypothetical protein|nr:hypothetical protein [Mycobacterium sp.]